MKNVFLAFAMLIAFNYAAPAFAAGPIRSFVTVGVNEVLDETSLLLASPNGAKSTAIECDSDRFSSIEVDDLGRGHWVLWNFSSHKSCMKAFEAIKKATPEYPAVVVIINGVATITE